MSSKRKSSSILSYALKMKVLNDIDAKLTKSEIAKLHGISTTSVSRILNNREQLEAMTSAEHDNKRKVRAKLTTKKISDSPKLEINDDTESGKFSAYDTDSMDKENFDQYVETNYLLSPPPTMMAMEIGENAGEESLERALRDLKQYTNMLLQCEDYAADNDCDPDDPYAKTEIYGALYELYEELMESENELWRRNGV